MNRAEKRKYIKHNKNQIFGMCPKCKQRLIYKYHDNDLYECLKCGIVEIKINVFEE